MENKEFLTKQQSELLIKKAKSLKHKVMIIIMLDSGLRVSEMLNLTFSCIDFKRQILKVKSLKKRGKNKTREIHLTDRLNEFLILWINHEKPSNPELKLFGEITRQAVNTMLKRLQESPELSEINLHPHKLRHTFATNLRATGSQAEDIKDLLGHENISTSLIYAHAKPEILRQRIEATQGKKSFLQRLWSTITPKTKPYFLNTLEKSLFIGREKEVSKIYELIEKNINTIILGEAGLGKSHLVENIKFNRQVLRIDGTENFKQSLKNVILFLFKNDKQALKTAIYGDLELSALETKINKETTQALCNLIVSITKSNEYIIFIDSLDNLTPRTAKAIEILKDHFTFITTARAVKINNSTFLWNFEKIELQALTRIESAKLINKWCIGIAEQVRTKILETAQGNPRMIYELCDRLNKEQKSDLYTAENIINNYLGKEAREFDVSFLIVLFLAVVAGFKYFASEMDSPELRILGGLAFILLILSRFIFQRLKRQTV